MFDILTLGDCTVDTYAVIDPKCPQTKLSKDKKLLCLNYADKITIREAGQSLGGNAANVAVGMQKLGFKTSILSELGDDNNGRFIFSELQKFHVDTSLCTLKKKMQTRYSFVLNYQGERTILSYHARRKYSLPPLPETRWIYYTSLGETFQNLQKKLLSQLHKHPDIKLAVNPGSYQLKYGIKDFKKILPFTSLLFLNKEEAEILVGKKQKPKNLMKSLCKKGVRLVVITDGEKGSYASDGKQFFFLSIFPVSVISKTGAGDAYASGFLSALLHEKPLTEAMCWGMANSAGVVREIGAQNGLLTQKQIEKLLKQFKDIRPLSLR